MAKGARASTVKRNNANLRAKIFGPAVDERTARLSAKLQDLVSKPRPDEERAMDIDDSAATEGGQDSVSAQLANDMEIDTNNTATKQKSSTRRKSSKVEKKMTRKKPKHQVVFPTSAAKRKRIAQSKKKSV